VLTRRAKRERVRRSLSFGAWCFRSFRGVSRLLAENFATKLVIVTLIRTAQRWSRIAVSDLERHQLQSLRQGLGIDPSPTSKKREDTPTEVTVAA